MTPPTERRWELINRSGTGVEVVGPSIKSNVTVLPASSYDHLVVALQEIDRRITAAQKEGWPTGPAAAMVARDKARTALQQAKEALGDE